MRRIWSLVVATTLGWTSISLAQNPGGDRPRGPQPPPGNRDSKERPRDEPRREESRREDQRREESRREDQRREESRREDRSGGQQVEQWMRMLAENMIHPHDAIRDSARAGLVAIGQPAVPMLRNLANGPDDARATAAKRVLEAIERNQRPPLLGDAGPRNRRGGMTGSGFGGGFGGGFGAGSPNRERGPMGPGGPFGRGGPMNFGGGFPGGPMGPRPEGRVPPNGERRPEGGERRPEGGERRPEAPRPSEKRPA